MTPSSLLPLATIISSTSASLTIETASFPADAVAAVVASASASTRAAEDSTRSSFIPPEYCLFDAFEASRTRFRAKSLFSSLIQSLSLSRIGTSLYSLVLAHSLSVFFSCRWSKSCLLGSHRSSVVVGNSGVVLFLFFFSVLLWESTTTWANILQGESVFGRPKTTERHGCQCADLTLCVCVAVWMEEEAAAAVGKEEEEARLGMIVVDKGVAVASLSPNTDSNSSSKHSHYQRETSEEAGTHTHSQIPRRRTFECVRKILCLASIPKTQMIALLADFAMYCVCS